MPITTEQIPEHQPSVATVKPTTTDMIQSTTISINDNHCMADGKKYNINELVEMGCESICKCIPGIGLVECQPRCPKTNHTTATHEQCVSVPDPKDPCCHIELCDVTLDDHEQGAIAILPPPDNFHRNNKNQTTTTTAANFNSDGNRIANKLNKNNQPNVTATMVKGDNVSDDDNDDDDGDYDCEHEGKKYKKGKIYIVDASSHVSLRWPQANLC